MIFQSKFTNHAFNVRPTRRVVHPVSGIVQPIPGLRAVFEGPQRLFDSNAAQLKCGWTDEERIQVEDWLLKSKAFGKSIFMAPGELRKLDEATIAKMRVKPKTKARKCLDIRIENGEAVQCQEEPTAGRDYCAKHDPEVAKILKGGVEQK